ncbi:hypothetical protein D3C79_711170 [compost metagenome]
MSCSAPANKYGKSMLVDDRAKAARSGPPGGVRLASEVLIRYLRSLLPSVDGQAIARVPTASEEMVVATKRVIAAVIASLKAL